MDIVYSIDDNFIPQAAALTASILEQAERSGAENAAGPSLYSFHILSNGIPEERRAMLSEFIRSKGAKAYFYGMDDLEERLTAGLGRKPETGRFAISSLGRILAPFCLPERVKTFLYLDADMICRKDLSQLFSTDLHDAVIAACAEPTIYEELTVTDPLGKRAYFNSGLLYVDNETWKREDVTGACLKWYAEHNGKTDYADQDILNNVLSGRILPLSQRWNFQTNYHYQDYGSLVKRSPWYGELETEKDYEDSRKDPCVVHFAGDERPWYNGNRNPYREEFYRYLSMTPFCDMKPVTGKEKYMAFYHAVNVLSEKIPGFRTFTSRVYYRVKKRK